MYITDNIRKLLQERVERSGLMRKEVAKEIGIKPPTLTRWLNGEITRINPYWVPALANFLGLSHDELLGMANPIAGRLLSSKPAPFQSIDMGTQHFAEWIDHLAPDDREFLLRVASGMGYEPPSPNTKKKRVRPGNKILHANVHA